MDKHKKSITTVKPREEKKKDEKRKHVNAGSKG